MGTCFYVKRARPCAGGGAHSASHHAGVCEKNILRRRKTGGKISFQSTNSGAGEQFLSPDCRAKGSRRRSCFFHRHQYYTCLCLYIYIYIYRERERDQCLHVYYFNVYIYIYIHTYTHTMYICKYVYAFYIYIYIYIRVYTYI